MNFFDQWEEVPDTATYDNGFKAQWEMFLRHVAEDGPWPYGLEAGAKGVQLAELGLQVLGRAPLARRPGAGVLTMATIDLPRNGAIEPYTTDRHAGPAREAHGRRLPAHRLRRGARRRRPAGRQRSVADAGDRLGRARSPSATGSGTSGSASPRRWTPPSAAWASAGPRRRS